MNRSLDDWLTYIGAVHPRTIEMGLERVSGVARRLGVTRPAARSVIVAGTNGKGSTSVALESLLLAAGLRVGTTLSPHVSRFNERIRIEGSELGDAELCGLFERVDAARGDVPLTYFEFAALAALLAFHDARLDLAILEIGLGGRLDAFNLVDADLAIVTSIGLDHQDYLGSDLEGIGREKAGVFRAGQTVVLGAVTRSVVAAAEDLGCEMFSSGRDFQVQEERDRWHYHCPVLKLRWDDLPRGSFAPSNCGLALTAAAALVGGQALDPLTLATLGMPGRMAKYRIDGIPVIVDVAHNPAGAEFLARQLDLQRPGQRFVGVLGCLEDKDAAGLVAALGERISHWLTIPTHGPRGQSAEALRGRIGRPATACGGFGDALERALSLTGPGDGILIFGSFSAVEQATERLSPGITSTTDG